MTLLRESGRAVARFEGDHRGLDLPSGGVGLRYFLTAGSEAEGAAEWWTPEDDEGRGWNDGGVTGPGPDFVEVPDTASPGDYRLCTANAGQNFCALLEVTA